MSIKENDAEIRDHDKQQKEKGKEYGDKRKRAHESDLSETLHTLRNEETGQVLRRNIIHLKKVEGEWKSIPIPEKNHIAYCVCLHCMNQ